MDPGAVASLPPPRDRFSFVYIIFLFMGVGCNLPLNVYITAKVYYQVRLAVEPTIPIIRNDFEVLFVNIFQVFNFAALIFVVAYSKKIPPRAQVLYPYLTIFTCFFLTTLMVFDVTLGGEIQSIVTLGFIAIVGVAAAFVQGGVYSLASKFAPIYMQAVMTGEAVAGVGVAILQFVSIMGSTVKAGELQKPEDVTGPGIGYFGGSTVIVAVCILGYGLLFVLPFSRYHLKHGYHPHHHIHIGEDGTVPLLQDGQPPVGSMPALPVLSTSPFAGSLVGSVPVDYAGSLASYMDYGTPKSVEEEPHIIISGAYHVGPVGTVGTLGDVIMHRTPTPSQYEPSYYSASQRISTEIRVSSEFGKDATFQGSSQRQRDAVLASPRPSNFAQPREDDKDVNEEFVNPKELHKDLSFVHLVDQAGNPVPDSSNNLNKEGEGMLKTQLKKQADENGYRNDSNSNGDIFNFQQPDKDGKEPEAFNPYVKDHQDGQLTNGKLVEHQTAIQVQEEIDLTLFQRFKMISGYCLTIALVFIVTLAAFPGISSDICSVRNGATAPPCIPRPVGVNRIFGDLFVPLGFIMYQCGDLSGRISAGFGPWRHNRPSAKWLILYACCRVVLLVALVFCNIITSPPWMLPNYLNNDAAPLLLLLFIGNTTGHCASTTMMHALTPLPLKEREGGGYILAFVMALGLLGGSSLSWLLIVVFTSS